MPGCPVRPNSVAAAAAAFVDQLLESGQVWPRESQEAPDREAWQGELLGRLGQLEVELNPARLSYKDGRGVAELLGWSNAEGGSVGVPTRRREEAAVGGLLAGLAVALDTILRWWDLEEVATVPVGRGWSVGPIGSKPNRKGNRLHLEKPEGWPSAIPFQLAGQMRAAAAAIMSKSAVRWPQPERAQNPVTAATVGAASLAADRALTAMRDVVDELERHPDPDPTHDLILLSYLHELQAVAARIPRRGWEPCYVAQAFRAFNTSGVCGHVAAANLATNVATAVGNAAWEAVRSRWGVPPRCHAVPLIWTPEARPALRQTLRGWGMFDLPYWLDQLAVEASRFVGGKKRGRVENDLKPKIISRIRELQTAGVKWRAIYDCINQEFGTNYEYSRGGSLHKMLAAAR